MSRMSRTKGATAEREVVRVLRAHGLDARRTALLQTHGFIGAADVEGLPGHHIEVKRCESIRIEEWCRQAEGDRKPGLIPFVVWRRSKQPWRVTLPLLDYLAVYARLAKAEAALERLTTERGGS